ncbi:MAG: glutamine--fructose-6-phosphate transaminase (isomerizing) [Nitrococcus sp.]|nr:glutamine--fructose-6-phosphate transaminase (isomerizing) [Nitrococcus sp.]
MCGIVGVVAERDAVAILLEGLKRLEYRGYDSAGIAVLDGANRLQRHRTIGKVAALVAAQAADPLCGHTGIAHTRWATHGAPTEFNAHPHIARDEIAVVHNGIIENHEDLRRELRTRGYEFHSQTDSEVIVNEIHLQMAATGDLRRAVARAVSRLDGAYALGVISSKAPGRLIAARKGSPLVIGVGIGENFIASDIAALLPVTQRFILLEDGDIAELFCERIVISDHDGQTVDRAIQTSQLSAHAVDRGAYRHFMLKEIHEQPRAVGETLEGSLSDGRVLEAAFGPEAGAILDRVERVQIVACGTSYHAGLVARYWCESHAGVACDVEVASEFRYRTHVLAPGTLFVTVSQSGETADTLSALREARNKGYLATLAICNVPQSSLVRESDLVLMTRAGPEIGVASTKAFTTQLTALLLLTIAIGRRHKLTVEREAAFVQALRRLPRQLEAALALEPSIEALAEEFVDKRHSLFLGRGAQYPIAMEGALKLKEISYIHAEAYPAGELKHGPLALVDGEMPVVTVAPNDELIEKLKSNLQEVRARNGRLYVFADAATTIATEDGCVVQTVPATDEITAPIVYTIPLQLLAYHVAVLKGTDVDQPRNLAKSVTVE